MRISELPGSVIGYRKDGREIRLIAGGDESNDPPEPTEPTGKMFTEEELNKLLERERNKLYGRLTKAEQAEEERKQREAQMQAELKELQDERKKREREDAKRQKEADDAARKAQEAELSAKELIERRQQEWEQQLAQREQEWTGQLSTLQEQIAQRDALLEREKEFAALAAYAQQKVNDARDEIAPELIDYITGNTPEEIDASIELAKAKSQQILQSLQQAQVQARAAMPGVSPAGYAPAGPVDMQGGVKQLTVEEIQGMSQADYAKLRMQPGMPGSVKQGQGLFG